MEITNIIRELDVFLNGMLCATVLILAVQYLVGRKNAPLYCKAFGVVMAYLCMVGIVDETLILTDLYSIKFFYDLDTFLLLMVVPFFEVMINTLVYQNPKNKIFQRRLLYSELPLIALCLVDIFNVPFALTGAIIYVFAYGVAFLIYYLREIYRFNRRIANAYADTEGRTLKWIIKMLIACGLLLVTFFTFTTNMTPWSILIHDIVSAVMFVHMDYYLRMQKPVDMSLLNKVQAADEEAMALAKASDEELDENMQALTAEKYKEIGQKLNSLIYGEMIYLSPDIKISDIAERIQVSSSSLSSFFNNSLHKSFSEFINELRLVYAKQLLMSNKNMPVDEVARVSGYESPASLQKAFSTYNNCTATQFRKTANKKSAPKEVAMPVVSIPDPNTEKAEEDTKKEEEAKVVIAKPKLGLLSEREPEREFRDYCFERYPHYRHSLLNYEPSLTNRDIMLCMLVVFDYNKWDISEALGLSMASYNVTRSRLRIKLKLSRSVSLRDFVNDVLNPKDENKNEESSNVEETGE